MLNYNHLVKTAFKAPQYAVQGDSDIIGCVSGQAGDRKNGVLFLLYYSPEKKSLRYKVYGNPYAIAAAEWLANETSLRRLNPGDPLDIDMIRELLDMPFSYLNILLCLEDAWNALGKRL
jgi:hypothetical protein